jgi:hypothetical protein
LLGEVSVLQRNPRPKGGEDDVGVANPRNTVVVAEYIGTYLQEIAVGQCRHIIIFVELMVAHAAMHLLVVLRCPVPKGMLGVVVIAEIADVAGKQQYVARHLQGVGFQIPPIVGKLQMQVGCVLYLHIGHASINNSSS